MSRRVAVVGGGLAGMAAALGAADRGAEVTLIERRARLGGLTWSFQRQGRWFDNGQHVFLRCCTAYRQFLQRIGATDLVHLQPRLEVPVLAPGGRVATIARTSMPAPLHLASSLVRYGHLSLLDRARLGRPAWAMRRLSLDDPALDTVSFARWLSERGQSDRAIDHLWNLIALPTLNVRADEASMALALKVFRTGLLDSADGGDIGWSVVPLRQLHADRGATALAEAGVEVVVSTGVDGVRPALAGSGDHLVVTTPDRNLTADAVVLATPPEVTASLAPAGVVGELEGLGASPIVNVHLVLDRKVTDLHFAACIDSPVQFFFDRTDSGRVDPAADGSQYLAISLSAADDDIGERPEDLIRRYHAALGDVLPVARRSQLVDAVVTREHTATFRATPGTARLRPPTRTALPGLYLAGAWCDTGWPATMEGAVRSGTTAAEAVISDLGGWADKPGSTGKAAA